MARGKWKPYDPDVAAQICELVSNGKSIVECAQVKGIPSRNVIYKWLDESEDFRDRYARARKERADLLADEIINLADGAEDHFGYDTEAFDPAKARLRLDAARLKIDTRKWAASKMDPKTYGDSKTIKGDEKEPLVVDLNVTPAKEAFLAAISEVAAEDGTEEDH